MSIIKKMITSHQVVSGGECGPNTTDACLAILCKNFNCSLPPGNPFSNTATHLWSFRGHGQRRGLSPIAEASTGNNAGGDAGGPLGSAPWIDEFDDCDSIYPPMAAQPGRPKTRGLAASGQLAGHGSPVMGQPTGCSQGQGGVASGQLQGQAGSSRGWGQHSPQAQPPAVQTVRTHGGLYITLDEPCKIGSPSMLASAIPASSMKVHQMGGILTKSSFGLSRDSP